MQDRDDELYTTMFNALRHGVRRKVLRILLKRKVSFTTLLKELEISSSHLTYHLDALGELISKDESLYTLSVFGKATVEMMTNIEDPPKRYFQNNPGEVYKYLFTILLTIFVITSALLVNLMDIQASQQSVLDSQAMEIQSLTNELKPLKRFSELYSLVISNPEIKVSSKVALSYFSSESAFDSYQYSILLIYSPDNNRVLEIDLMTNVPLNSVVPLTVQKGNALLNESSTSVPEMFRYNESVKWMSKVIWRKTSTDSEDSYRVILSERGWYTVSLVGPVVFTESGKPMIQPLSEEANHWTINDYIRIWADCRLLNGKDSASFGFMTIDPTEFL